MYRIIKIKLTYDEDYKKDKYKCNYENCNYLISKVLHLVKISKDFDSVNKGIQLVNYIEDLFNIPKMTYNQRTPEMLNEYMFMNDYYTDYYKEKHQEFFKFFVNDYFENKNMYDNIVTNSTMKLKIKG